MPDDARRRRRAARRRLADILGKLRLISSARIAADAEANDRLKKTSEKAAKDRDAIPLAEAAKAVVARLRDLSGYGEAKTWGLRLAQDLHDYKVGELDWQDVDCGVLLSGVPGCGKTFYANALAAECEVPLVVTTYTDWQDGSAGDTMARGLKKQFAAWRKQAQDGPFILFVDEIDSIGARTENGNNETWFRTIVNAWLAFLDGAEPRTGVVVIAATNFPDRIDPALCRPGRLDRHVKLPTPTIADLAGVIKFHLGAPAANDDLAAAARACRGQTPAEIAQAARDARRVARRAKRQVTPADVADVASALFKRPPADDEHWIALHEAAHAVIARRLRIGVVCVDLDRTHTMVEVKSLIATRGDIESQIVGLLSGRAAEVEFRGDPSVGATRDLEIATSFALAAISRGGVGGSLVYLTPEIAIRTPTVMAQVEAMLDTCAERAASLVKSYRDDVERVAEALVEQRYLDGDEVDAILDPPKRPPFPESCYSDDDDGMPDYLRA